MHNSALRDWGEIESIAGWPRGTPEYTHTDVLDILSRQKALNYLPGDQWSYTNSGYNLAAMLVERVSFLRLYAHAASASSNRYPARLSMIVTKTSAQTFLL